MTPPLDPLVAYFESLSPENLDRLADFYAADAVFRDPFNDVRGVAAITRVFADMFERLERPRFIVRQRFHDTAGAAAMLLWEFRFSGVGRGEQCIDGATHLRFDAEGRIVRHQDYWDAAGGLYEKLPLLGALMRALRRRVAA